MPAGLNRRPAEHFQKHPLIHVPGATAGQQPAARLDHVHRELIEAQVAPQRSVHTCPVPGHFGRIKDHRVEAFVRCGNSFQGLEAVAFKRLQPVADPVEIRVGPGQLQGRLGDVDRDHFPCSSVDQSVERKAARVGEHVEDFVLRTN